MRQQSSSKRAIPRSVVRPLVSTQSKTSPPAIGRPTPTYSSTLARKSVRGSSVGIPGSALSPCLVELGSPVIDSDSLEHFPPKWMPVRRRKCDQTKESRACPDSAESGRALAHPHRIAQEAAEPRAAAADGLAVALEARKALDELPDRHHRLHARERQAGAGVDAGAEGQMPVRMTAQIEPVGIGELQGIAVGGADADVHIGAGGHRHARERRVPGGPAVAELVRAFHAKKL